MKHSAQDDIKLYEALTKSTYYVNDRTLSQDVASLFAPRRADISEQKSEGTEAGWYDKIYEPHPINAANTLSTGQYDLLFTGKWFETDAPVEAPTHEQKKAYFEAGKRMRREIDASNFKLEVQEFLFDRSTTHTSALLIEQRKGRAMFTHIPRGRYAIAEDPDKYVDTLVRWFKLTARQAVQKFDEEDDTLPPKVLDAAKNVSTENKEFTFIHVIRPNYQRDPNSDHKKDKPWSSRYVCKDQADMHVRVSGYDEQPFVVSRFNRWGDSPYGTGPAHIELGRARGLQVMRRDLLALGSRVSSPGVVRLGGSNEDWDPYGENIVSEEEAALGLPREVRYAENYTIPESLYESEKRALDETFFVPLFRLLTSEIEQKREKTAYETQKMLEEQVGRASPTFSRLNEEVLNILLNRVFGIMLRLGRFDDILDGLILDEVGEGKVNVREPAINFTSKLAMAMKAVQSNSFMQWLSENQLIIELRPDVLDNFDWDKKARDSWEDHGLPVDQMASEDDVEQYREQQRQLQQAAIALQGAEQMSNVTKNLK